MSVGKNRLGAFFARLAEDRHLAVRYEVIGDHAIVTGPRDGLLPRAAIPSMAGGFPVKKVDERAFAGCDFLDELTICDGVEVLGVNAFSACEHLTKVFMADSVREIGRNCFFECKNMFCVELSHTLRTIGDRAFYGCEGLRDITLPDSIESIGEQAFYGCRRLKTIHIPLALTHLPRSAFDNCTALEHIYLEKGSPADLVLSKSGFYTQKLRYIPRF